MMKKNNYKKLEESRIHIVHNFLINGFNRSEDTLKNLKDLDKTIMMKKFQEDIVVLIPECSYKYKGEIKYPPFELNTETIHYDEIVWDTRLPPLSVFEYGEVEAETLIFFEKTYFYSGPYIYQNTLHLLRALNKIANNCIKRKNSIIESNENLRQNYVLGFFDRIAIRTLE